MAVRPCSSNENGLSPSYTAQARSKPSSCESRSKRARLGVGWADSREEAAVKAKALVAPTTLVAFVAPLVGGHFDGN
jgi:hypothetical protein